MKLITWINEMNKHDLGSDYYSLVVSVQLVTSICPSVWGWQVVLKSNLVPTSLHRLLQKCDMNLVSLSDTMVLGIP